MSSETIPNYGKIEAKKETRWDMSRVVALLPVSSWKATVSLEVMSWLAQKY